MRAMGTWERWYLGAAVALAVCCGVATSARAEACGALCWENATLRAQARARYQTRLEGVSSFPLDRYGTTLSSNFFFLPVVRVGTAVESRYSERVQWTFDYEHDLLTGTEDGTPADRVGAQLPNGRRTHDEIRRLFLRVTVPAAHLVLGGGYTLSHWGLGLLANDGAHGWSPDNAYFGDPRSGDRVIRATVGTTPLTRARIVLRAAWDDVRGDDVLLRGDSAEQFIGSVLAGQGLDQSAGLYIVYRPQDARVRRGFDVVVYDVFAQTRHPLGSLGTLTVAGETAVVNGSTSLGPTVDFPKHDILQVGATVKSRLDRGSHGFALDFLFASGDENFDDDEQNNFKADPNFEFGLLLYRFVQAAQSGRTTVTAADPTLVGRPVPDLERIPTRGGATNTVAIFPRAWWRPTEEFALYGGPLLAWSDVKYADAFETRIAGGDPHNALGGRPGRFYGAELDLGARYRGTVGDLAVSFGVEGGILFPGNAFRKRDGGTMSEVWGGRALLEVAL